MSAASWNVINLQDFMILMSHLYVIKPSLVWALKDGERSSSIIFRPVFTCFPFRQGLVTSFQPSFLGSNPLFAPLWFFRDERIDSRQGEQEDSWKPAQRRKKTSFVGWAGIDGIYFQHTSFLLPIHFSNWKFTKQSPCFCCWFSVWKTRTPSPPFVSGDSFPPPATPT